MIDFLQNTYPIVFLSLKVAIWAIFLNSIFAITTAYFIAKHHFWGRELCDKILTLPMVLPPTVLGYYLLVLLGSHSMFGQWLNHTFAIRLIFTWQGAVIAAMLVTFPLIYKPARTAFESVPTQLENAARILGLPERALFWRVSLPLAKHGIMSGILLAFARALGEFGATLMIAGSIPGKTETLSIAIYEAVQAGEERLANGLVLLISVICIVVLWLLDSVQRQKGRW